MKPPESSVEVREHLVKALEADLVGPYNPETGEELLKLPPSRYYLTGFLAPEQNRVAIEDIQNSELAGDQTGKNADGTETEDGRTEAPRRFWPASLGLTLLVPGATKQVMATVRFAQYVAKPASEALGKPLPPPKKGKDGKKKKPREKLLWRRVQREYENVALPLPGDDEVAEHELEGKRGVRLVIRAIELTDVPGVEAGARAVSVFVVNGRELPRELSTEQKRRRDEKSIFQVELSVTTSHGVLPRPDHSTIDGDRDDKILDLQYRHTVEYAVGHGVATEPLKSADGNVVGARTVWLPRSEVVKVDPAPIDGVKTDMGRLAALESAAEIDDALASLPTEYEAWIQRQEKKSDRMDERRREMRDDLVKLARHANRRIAAGIELLKSDADVLTAFRLTNEAMASAAQRKNPAWYPFQLAFLLLNLRGIARPEDATERDQVELIFFPTGGGKTEAYLGVIAFTLFLRRIRGRKRRDKGLGVAVLLRYTLRLLTLDQYGRAARLVCALELLRRKKTDLLGDTRFALGLWVGRSATPNTIKDFIEQHEDYRDGHGDLPFPLAACPVCGHDFDAPCFHAEAESVRVVCKNRECDFSRGDGLPLLFVDEAIYRELPAFLIGTVDKFAMLPHRAEIGALFGKRVVGRRDGAFLNPDDTKKRTGVGFERFPGGLRPPELIVQDELHLISGPLGTMVGLYETALEALCTDVRGAHRIRPKILAATATVRRSSTQIQALFGRPNKTRLFPPPGSDAWDTFFAEISKDANKRMYLGVAAAGRPMKRILISVYLTLLAAAQHCYPIPIHEKKKRKVDGKEPEPTEEDHKRAELRTLGAREQPAADPYATLVGYFNSLRELGGMRRLVEDEIYGRLRKIEDRRPVDADEPHLWLRNRLILSEPVELTSREKTHTIKDSKKQLEQPIVTKKRVDVCLASNMISVGVDIDRLGLMVIAGQPKSTSEYIQCSSRVGRDKDRPGLVVTAYNLAKPRDRSHYEHFGAYHEGFYRHVESQSLTPFSEPALDRGLVGALVGLTRHSSDELCPAKGVMKIGDDASSAAVDAVSALKRRAALHSNTPGPIAEDVRKRADHLIQAWRDTVTDATADWSYSRYDKKKGGKKLLYPTGDERADDEAKLFGAPTSMRDVESTVHLWMFRSKSKSNEPDAAPKGAKKEA